MGKSRNIGSMSEAVHVSAQGAINIFEHVNQNQVNVLSKETAEVLKGGTFSLLDLENWEQDKVLSRHKMSMGKQADLAEDIAKSLEAARRIYRDNTIITDTGRLEPEVGEHIIAVVVRSAMPSYLRLLDGQI